MLSVVFILEFGWSIMTLCTTWVTTYQQIYVIRFFVGLFESAYYPGLRECRKTVCPTECH